MTPNDVKIVADNIDDFIEVPDGISRLRKAVLALAVSGKLVPQDKKDGSAAELYARIQSERIETSSGKKVIKQSNPVLSEEILFEIPKSWKWVRLGGIVKVKTGTLDANASSPDGKYPFFTCADQPLKIDRYAYDCECVLLAGNGNFNVKYYEGKFEAYQRTYIIEAANSEVFVPYVYLLVQMQTDRFKSTSLGSAMPYIRLGYITEAVVSLPPFLEQKRIVAKVRELLAQLDELEIKKQERDEVRTRLTRSAIQFLGKGESKIAFEHLTELVQTPVDLKELESALLTLAVSGKLVAQRSDDEQISLLLKQIDDERTNTAKTDHRADENLQTLLAEELCPEIPSTWVWRGLADVALFIDYRGKTPKKTDSGIRLITAKNVRPRHIKLDPQEFISEKIYKEWMTRGFPKVGDVLFTTEAPMGNAAVVDISEKFGLAQRVINLRPYEGIDGSFLMLQLSSGVFQSMLNKTASGMTAKGIKASKLKQLPIAVPSLAEQKRIVKKVEEAMVLINRLKKVIGEK